MIAAAVTFTATLVLTENLMMACIILVIRIQSAFSVSMSVTLFQCLHCMKNRRRKQKRLDLEIGGCWFLSSEWVSDDGYYECAENGDRHGDQ